MNIIVTLVVLIVVCLFAMWFTDKLVTDPELNQIVKVIIFLLVIVYALIRLIAA